VAGFPEMEPLGMQLHWIVHGTWWPSQPHRPKATLAGTSREHSEKLMNTNQNTSGGVVSGSITSEPITYPFQPNQGVCLDVVGVARADMD